MKTRLIVLALLAGGSMFAQTRFSVGVSVGGNRGYYPETSYVQAAPPCPGPDYSWVDGYWSESYGRRNWVAGYWNRQPYRSTYYVAPRYEHRDFENRYDRGYGRRFDRDDDRGRGRNDDHRQYNGYSNGFRNR